MKKSVSFLMLLFLFHTASASAEIQWQPWTDDIFERAKKENKFVILDLHAVWCHWCHVMEDTTYRDPKVTELIESRYIAARADQDAHPDLSARYENWGWPATVVFSPQGEEIVKRRGYIPPEPMASLLDAIIKDPTPGPSVFQNVPVKAAEKGALKPEQRAKLEADHLASYDAEFGGWGGGHKLIDADNIEISLVRAEKGDPAETVMARKTLDAALNLLDPEWGGFYQYSDARDWKSPHYEKLIWIQADYARIYSLAYATFMEPRYYEAARATLEYVLKYLTSPDGVFYVSQDADMDAQFNGYTFYSLKGSERERLGRSPKVDTHLYARENGWMIRALTAFYDATGEEKYLIKALAAAQWTLTNRLLDTAPAGKGQGFRHDAEDRAGPYLGDTLAMGQAFLSLYESTADRQWLVHAQNAADFIERVFKKDGDAAGGYFSSAAPAGSAGVFKDPVKHISENIQIARLANRLFHATGRAFYRSMAEDAMRFLASDQVAGGEGLLTGILYADSELGSDPMHLAILGKKEDPDAKTLYHAALGTPSVYRRMEWWDRREGPLPHSDVDYPELEKAAAFVCAEGACSTPIFSPEKISATLELFQKG